MARRENTMSRISILAVLVLSSVDASAQYAIPQIELTAGMYRIEAEVVTTPEQRATGLMRRAEMPPQHGMLFVFPQEMRHCMWMKNTLLPLSVAFLDRAGKIINVEEMQPQTENSHCAKAEARYALEMNVAWFKTRGLNRGAQIVGVEKAPVPR
jgi:uncharacterized membrane protein (UPF0127 family)